MAVRIFKAIFFTAISFVPSSNTNTAKTKFTEVANKFFDEFWEWRLLNNPQLATKVGVREYDDQLNDMSLDSYKRREKEIRSFLDRLNNITKNVMMDEETEVALNINLLQDDLEQYLSGMKFKPYLWPLNNMEGPHVDFINLLERMKKNTVEDMTNIITRIRLLSVQIGEIIELLKEGIRLELTMNRRSFEKLIVVYGQVATAKVEDNPFFFPFKEKPLNISNAMWKLILFNAKQSIEYHVQPSFARLQKFLREKYLVLSRPQIGVTSIRNGKDYYQGCLRFHTTTNLTAKEIYDIGLSEVERITKRMEEVKTKVRFNGTLSQFRAYVRKNKKLSYQNENEMLEHYRGIETRVRKAMKKYFGRYSTIPFLISAVPKELASMAPFAYYNEPAPDGTIPGTFFINTYQPKSRRKHIAMAVFLHEALPGHHHQIASKMEFGSSVLFRRFAGMDMYYYEVPACFAGNSAYTEGWGLYSEYLGEEMGLYDDPYDLFGRLSLEMLRAVRLVVDPGMHALGWSRQKAFAFILENTSGSIQDAMTETDRYISWPGQACSYKIGEIKLKELRRLAETKLGEKFDIQDFHDFVISLGNIPLRVLEKQIRLYIKKRN